MLNYSISEEFKIPSKGKLYENVGEVVKLRSMTTEEELKRLSPSKRPYKKMCEIIDDCIVDPIGISSYDMCISDYQFLLHKLRVVTYGKDYNMSCTCPHCSSTEEEVIDLDKLKVTYLNTNSFESVQRFKLPKTGQFVTIKIQTPRMLDNVTADVEDLNERSKGKAVNSTLVYTVCNLIDTVDGEKLDAVQLETFVRGLPMMDTSYILQYAQKLQNLFGIDTTLDRVCKFCGGEFQTSFRVTSEFFGPTFNI